MIVYKLKCSFGHESEGWFKDIKSFEKQKKLELVTCPVCGNNDISKIPTSTRSIKSKEGKETNAKSQPPNIGYALLKKMMNRVKKNFENVGEKFPEEARKIHYGETPAKNIYGTTTEVEEKKLKEEGIEFFKFPILKDKDD